MRRVFVIAVLFMGIVGVSAQAQAVLINGLETTLYAPTVATASTEYPGLGVGGLFDGAIYESDFEIPNPQAAQQVHWAGNWACSGAAEGDPTNPSVAMDFGSSTTFNSLVFGNRGVDMVDSIDLWFGASAYTAGTIPGTAADETVSPIQAYAHGIFSYDFAGDQTGRYVLARFNTPYANGSGNPGGIEMRLGYAVPEPSALALLTCGLFGLLAYAWRKRK